MKHLALIILYVLAFTIPCFPPLMAMAQVPPTVTLLKQKAFPKTIPPGNYSGISWLGGNRYAVVSDKSAEDGFFVFEIDVDSVSGEILNARNLGFHSSGKANRDDEGIAYNPQSNTVFISGESDNYIYEYDISGQLTGRCIPPIPRYRQLPGNLGLEALSYDPIAQRLWTCNESGDVYIQSYDSLLRPQSSYTYQIDAPLSDRTKANFFAHGIGTLCALPDGNLLLLEREFYVPKKKLGSFVNCKLYFLSINTLTTSSSSLSPVSPPKTLLAQWKTKLTIFDRSIANYEGMCLGPTLKDGSRVMLLVADSQDQYHGVLKDWLKSLKLGGLKQVDLKP